MIFRDDQQAFRSSIGVFSDEHWCTLARWDALRDSGRRPIHGGISDMKQEFISTALEL